MPLPINSTECNRLCGGNSVCACDSFSSNGVPSCACKNGYSVTRVGNKDVCESRCCISVICEKMNISSQLLKLCMTNRTMKLGLEGANFTVPVTVCPIGEYQEEVLSSNRGCEKCPEGQTTVSVGSLDKNQCVCKHGFWNPIEHSRNQANSSKTLPCTR